MFLYCSKKAAIKIMVQKPQRHWVFLHVYAVHFKKEFNFRKGYHFFAKPCLCLLSQLGCSIVYRKCQNP